MFKYKLPSTTRNFLSAIGLLDPFEDTDNSLLSIDACRINLTEDLLTVFRRSESFLCCELARENGIVKPKVEPCRFYVFMRKD